MIIYRLKRAKYILTVLILIPCYSDLLYIKYVSYLFPHHSLIDQLTDNWSLIGQLTVRTSQETCFRLANNWKFHLQY